MQQIGWFVLTAIAMRSSVEGASCFEPRPVAFWPLNAASELHDNSGNGNDASGDDVKLASGPGDIATTAYEFFGRDTSFLTVYRPAPLLDLGMGDKRSFSYSAYIYPTKTTGSLIEWNPEPNYLGLQVWLRVKDGTTNYIHAYIPDYDTKDDTSAKVTTKDGPVVPFVLNKWQFVAVSYDYDKAQITVKVDTSVQSKTVAKVRPRTNGNIPRIYLGQRVRHTEKAASQFKGKMSCVMVFNLALTPTQMEEAKTYCQKLGSERIRKAEDGSTVYQPFQKKASGKAIAGAHLLATKTGVASYIECARHCLHDQTKCHTVSYSAATKGCQLSEKRYQAGVTDASSAGSDIFQLERIGLGDCFN